MSQLQQRAERLAREFKTSARRPVVIEFSGSPKAGKTTTLSSIQSFLKRCGFKIEVVQERASVCPIRDKHRANFNVWTACTTLAQILEKTQPQHESTPHPDSPDILILDRGLFDAIVWLFRMQKLAHVSAEDLEKVERFLLISDWRKRVDAVVVMTAMPEDSMAREKGVLPYEGLKGSIMNEPWLNGFKATVAEVAKRLEKSFRIFQIDTSKDKGMDQKSTAEKVCGIILDVISEQLEENVLCVPREQVIHGFAGKEWAKGTGAEAIADLFLKNGSFLPRAEAESSAANLQAIPAVVIRTQDGRVLRLRRREKLSDNPLHERHVIWAGGHVRKEDATNGSSLLHGATREVDEELQLTIEPRSLEFLGAIFTDLGGSSSKHVGIVYQWTAPSDDVDIVLSGNEFFERRGESLRGQFAEVTDLMAEVSKASTLLEPWSQLIVQRLLPRTAGIMQESFL